MYQMMIFVLPSRIFAFTPFADISEHLFLLDDEPELAYDDIVSSSVVCESAATSGNIRTGSVTRGSLNAKRTWFEAAESQGQGQPKGSTVSLDVNMTHPGLKHPDVVLLVGLLPPVGVESFVESSHALLWLG